jgi:hypothetical protein
MCFSLVNIVHKMSLLLAILWTKRPNLLYILIIIIIWKTILALLHKFLGLVRFCLPVFLRPCLWIFCFTLNCVEISWDTFICVREVHPHYWRLFEIILLMCLCITYFASDVVLALSRSHTPSILILRKVKFC